MIFKCLICKYEWGKTLWFIIFCRKCPNCGRKSYIYKPYKPYNSVKRKNNSQSNNSPNNYFF